MGNVLGGNKQELSFKRIIIKQSRQQFWGQCWVLDFHSQLHVKDATATEHKLPQALFYFIFFFLQASTPQEAERDALVL